jgi:AraC-like DNA-binding protein/thiol-disulfide isomerase/thioredoxin
MEQPQEIYLLDHMVARLTCSQFIKEETELRKFCAEGGFYPETDRFCVLVVRIERWSSVFSTDAQWQESIKHHFFVISNMLTELLNREHIAVVAEKDYQMVSIINVKKPWEETCRELKPMLRQVMEVLEAEFDASVTIAVSDQVEGLCGIPDAYQSAQEALWYNDFLGRDQQIIFYDALNDEQNRPEPRVDHAELDKKLLSKLQAVDVAGVKYVLHEMIDRELIDQNPTAKILRIRLGGICCRILDALTELRSKMGDSLYYRLNPGPRIAEAKTLAELTTNMDDIFDTICRQQNAEHQEPKPQWVDKMAVYIEEHYTDENLGLTEVSTAFGITPSYATRVFKQYTGRGIYETIQHVRLTAAKGLLHTDKTMKQIAETVGYTSFLSMNRAFKKYEGTTPSQFKG